MDVFCFYFFFYFSFFSLTNRSQSHFYCNFSLNFCVCFSFDFDDDVENAVSDGCDSLNSMPLINYRQNPCHASFCLIRRQSVLGQYSSPQNEMWRNAEQKENETEICLKSVCLMQNFSNAHRCHYHHHCDCRRCHYHHHSDCPRCRCRFENLFNTNKISIKINS